MTKIVAIRDIFAEATPEALVAHQRYHSGRGELRWGEVQKEWAKVVAHIIKVGDEVTDEDGERRLVFRVSTGLEPPDYQCNDNTTRYVRVWAVDAKRLKQNGQWGSGRTHRTLHAFEAAP